MYFKEYFDKLTYGKAILCNDIFKYININKCEKKNNWKNPAILPEDFEDFEVFQSFLCSELDPYYIAYNDCCTIYWSPELNLYIINILFFGTPWESVKVHFINPYDHIKD